MKKVWVFRHGPKESGAGKNVIAPEMALKNPDGIELTRRVVDTFLKGQQFRAIFVSPLVRAYQTGVIFAQLLGMDFPKIESGLVGPNLPKWAAVISRLKSYTCADFYHLEPSFVQEEGERLFETIQLIAKSLEDGDQGLCASHGGLIEPAMAAAMTRLGCDFKAILRSIKDLSEGDGFIFQFDENNNFVGLEEKRL